MAKAAAVLAGVGIALLLTATGLFAGRQPSAPPTTPAPSAAVAAPTVTPTQTPAGAAVASAQETQGAPAIDPRWVATYAAATGITPVAIRAYAAASVQLATEQPGCRIGWNTLAGIGQVETGHGQGRLDALGRSEGTIEGPALDGSGGNAAITEGGTWDNARGPMQFIASTWRKWATDGDGDGTADVDDIDDAALAAARYLCASGGDLTTAEGWSRAVFSYNHSDDYVAAVLAAANGYAAAAG